MIFIASTVYGEIVVVTSISSDVESLDKKSVKNVFLGKKKFLSNGARIIVVDQAKESEVFAPFYITAIGKRPSQLSKYRVKRIFTGEIQAPKKVSSSMELVRFLKNHKNSIGYMKNTDLTPDLKVLYTVK